MTTAHEAMQIAAYEAETAVQAAKAAREAAKRLAPVDGRDPASPIYRDLASHEQSAIARLNPRRNRWPELGKFDEQVSRIEDTRRRLADEREYLAEQLQAAEGNDRQALADWHLEGGSRPTPTVPALAARVEEIDAEAEAAALAIDSVLDGKTAYVAKHRRRLTADAEQATTAALTDYLGLLTQVEQARADLIDLRAATVWAALYPSASLTSTPPTHALAGGRQKIQARHLPGLKSELPATGVFALLRDDAEHNATVATVDQAAEIQGVTRAALTQREAVWGGSSKDRDHERTEKQAALEAYKREWGHYPAEYPAP